MRLVGLAASQRLFSKLVPRGFELLTVAVGTVTLQKNTIALDATGEAADAVYAALDSVNLGQDERELIYIPGTGPTGASTNGLLSVEDIISWAASFPAEAGSLLQSAGNIGVASIRNRASDLDNAVSSLQTFAVPGVSPSGLGHPRVTYALDVLADTLTDVNKYASDPGLTYATPTTP